MSIIPYALQSVSISGLLYCFYRIIYFNRPHHNWNRFYLLGAMLASLVIPLITITIPVITNPANIAVTHLLDVVPVSKTEPQDVAAPPASAFDARFLLDITYLLISSLLLFSLLRTLLRIKKIYSSSIIEKRDNLPVALMNENTSPFSFFHVIFWNSKIDQHSKIGEQIFEHEKVHVKQFHSADRLLINILLILFWWNPFIWLIKKEITAVHEFIADKNSVPDSNPAFLSEMLLLSAFPSENFSVASSFFNSSIKRRLSMLTTFKNSTAGHFSKWMVLPLVLIVFAAFTLRKKEISNAPHATFTLVLDAGHGGEKNGTTAADGTKEKDLNLSIARKIRDLNKNGNLKIVMTRDNDEDSDPRARVEFGRSAKADAFVSIHVNNDPSGTSGIQVMMTKKSTEFTHRSQLLGTLVSHELKNVYTMDGELRKTPPDRGVWVLDSPDITYPSLLIECGNLANEKDREFIKSDANQEKLAQHILNAVNQFAQK